MGVQSYHGYLPYNIKSSLDEISGKSIINMIKATGLLYMCHHQFTPVNTAVITNRLIGTTTVSLKGFQQQKSEASFQCIQ